MEFADVVMKRRAVRRFAEAGVPRETIEQIARLAQRAPSGRDQSADTGGCCGLTTSWSGVAAMAPSIVEPSPRS